MSMEHECGEVGGKMKHSGKWRVGGGHESEWMVGTQLKWESEHR